MTRLALISDTHTLHERLVVPECDVLVHAGDFTQRGTRKETESVFAWLAKQPAKIKIVIAGNHDFFAEEDEATVRSLARQNDLVYLVDEPTEAAGLSMWGSPISPEFCNMAFNRDRGEKILAHWRKIPAGLDILITHGPPEGLGDKCFHGRRVGCADLLNEVRARPPRVHIYGHIHEDAGEFSVPGIATRFMNVCSCELRGGVRQPFLLDL